MEEAGARAEAWAGVSPNCDTSCAWRGMAINAPPPRSNTKRSGWMKTRIGSTAVDHWIDEKVSRTLVRMPRSTTSMASEVTNCGISWPLMRSSRSALCSEAPTNVSLVSLAPLPVPAEVAALRAPSTRGQMASSCEELPKIGSAAPPFAGPCAIARRSA